MQIFVSAVYILVVQYKLMVDPESDGWLRILDS